MNEYKDILITSIMIDNHYLQVKALFYIASLYFHVGERTIATELIEYTLKEYEYKKLSCRTLLFSLIDLHTTLSHKLNPLVKEFMKNLESLIGEQALPSKGHFINSKNELNQEAFILFYQYSIIKFNLALRLKSPQTLYENMNDIEYSTQVLDSMLQAISYINYDNKDTIS